MKTNIFIPKVINVGYQNRRGTYTGKLAYVIYYDNTGKLRKEKSWNSWRDENIPSTEFDNVPTEGFVLNKKVGDYDSGWNHRHAYCRVFDPRGFEFEISFENLLYILENTSSIKGKGLEGEFVYGWDGKDLVLMPVGSVDYKEIEEYNKIIHNNEHIKTKDLVTGATYIDKNNEEYIYMGRFDYYGGGYKYKVDDEEFVTKYYNEIPYKNDNRLHYDYTDILYGKKYHWFARKYLGYEYVNGKKVYNPEYGYEFIQMKSIPKGKFIKCINDQCDPGYSNAYDAMTYLPCFSPRDESKTKYIRYTFEEFKKYATTPYELYGRKRYYDRFYGYSENSKCYQYSICKDFNKEDHWKVYAITSDSYNDFYTRFNNIRANDFRMSSSSVTLEELFTMLKPCYKEEYLANGNLYERECYYGE